MNSKTHIAIVSIPLQVFHEYVIIIAISSTIIKIIYFRVKYIFY